MNIDIKQFVNDLSCDDCDDCDDYEGYVDSYDYELVVESDMHMGNIRNKDFAKLAFKRHKPLPLEYYLVGGAVRDCVNQDNTLYSANNMVSDYDFVVIGSSPEEMISLGFEQVGSSFPVFLHPDTRDEFALARNKVNGEITWKDATLKTDLLLRDFKVNSMAMDREGNIIHFFGDGFVENFNYVNNLSLTYDESLEDDPLRFLRCCRISSVLGGNNYYPNIPMEKITPSFVEKSKRIPEERLLKELYKVAEKSGGSINKFISRYDSTTENLRQMNIHLYGMKFNSVLYDESVFINDDKLFNLGMMLFYNIFPILGEDKKVARIANIIKLAKIIEGLYYVEFAPDETIYDILCKVSETRGCRDIIEKYSEYTFSGSVDDKLTLLKSIIESFDKTKFNDDTSIHISKRVEQFKKDKDTNVRNAIDSFFVIKKLEG